MSQVTRIHVSKDGQATVQRALGQPPLNDLQMQKIYKLLAKCDDINGRQFLIDLEQNDIRKVSRKDEIK